MFKTSKIHLAFVSMLAIASHLNASDNSSDPSEVYEALQRNGVVTGWTRPNATGHVKSFLPDVDVSTVNRIVPSIAKLFPNIGAIERLKVVHAFTKVPEDQVEPRANAILNLIGMLDGPSSAMKSTICKAFAGVEVDQMEPRFKAMLASDLNVDSKSVSKDVQLKSIVEAFRDIEAEKIAPRIAAFSEFFLPYIQGEEYNMLATSLKSFATVEAAEVAGYVEYLKEYMPQSSFGQLMIQGKHSMNSTYGYLDIVIRDFTEVSLNELPQRIEAVTQLAHKKFGPWGSPFQLLTDRSSKLFGTDAKESEKR